MRLFGRLFATALAGGVTGAALALLVSGWTGADKASRVHAEVTALSARLDQLASALVPGQAPSGPDANMAPPAASAADTDALRDLDRRLRLLEESVAVFLAGDAAAPGGSFAGAERFPRGQAVAEKRRRGTERGEDLFYRDSGPPIGIAAEDIASVFVSHLGRDVPGDVACKASVCRITLGEPVRLSPDGDQVELTPGDVILEQLAEQYNLDALNAHFAVDESGNEVMYLYSPPGP